MRHDPDSTEIEAIRVPAGLNRHVGMISLVRVALTSSEEQSELVVVEIEHVASKLGGELGSPRAVVGIGDFVESARVVENGEQGDDFDVRSGLLSQSATVFEDSGPVRHAVIAAQWQGVVFEDGLENGEKVHPAMLSLADDIYDGLVSLGLLRPVRR